jgi:hypothetical protein
MIVIAPFKIEGGEGVSSLGLILMGGNPPIKKEVTILTDCPQSE